jgi:hypothetical protein
MPFPKSVLESRKMHAQPSFSFVHDPPDTAIAHSRKGKRSGAFTDNMSLPVHRWFRYSAGFSGEWAETVIREKALTDGQYVFDPFVGSGTSLLAAERAGAAAGGVDSHSFVYRVARAKLLWHHPDKELHDSGIALIDTAAASVRERPETSSPLLIKCYTKDALCRLESLKRAYRESFATLGPVSELLWLVITSILRECSGVGTAQWQYILPNKTKARVRDPFAAARDRIELFCADMRMMKRSGASATAELYLCDSRDPSSVAHLNGRVGLVVTSPPYPNNYDYADATRLEMTFWEEVDGWGDLQKTIRHRLVRSCSQHSAAERLCLDDLLGDNAIAPIRNELTEVCRRLESVRETKGGKKTYHTMVAAYFADLARTWWALRQLCADGADIHFVIGDSAPYGVYVPAERWLGELSIAAGFKTFSFEKIRDRNVKWKNRKHRVPLKEGVLRVRG